ncbi:zinc finger protein [Trypanosoma melophagium]|uniref:zinc finger protein n=1 Tax=Trypanosoma melophagium TaxID=715481 RepID=UPI003519EFC6|nr:zinc finger protein [Trypanosoma melophagium]
MTTIPAQLSASSCNFEDYTSIGHPAGSSSNSGETVIKPILAERYKTKLCRNYMETGVCPYQSRCMFAHGEYELRTAEMNVCDGLVTEEAIRAFRRQWRRATATPAFQPQYKNNIIINNDKDNNHININNDFQGAYFDGEEDYGTPIPIPNGDGRRNNNNNNNNINNENAYMYYSYPQKPLPHIPAMAAADNTISPYQYQYPCEYEYDYYNDYSNYNDYNYYNYYSDMYVPYVYTHNPYAYNLLPPESRLYSQLPALLPTPQERKENENYNQQELCNAVNHTDVMNGDAVTNTNTTVITTEPHSEQSLHVKIEEEKEKEANNNKDSDNEDDDNAELSTCSCSSIGSESAEIQQLSPETKYRTGEDQSVGEIEQKNVC